MLGGDIVDDGSGLHLYGFIKAVVVIGLVIVGGHYLLRPFFRLVASLKSFELFTAAALLVVVGMALLMQSVGLSMELGSFLAGVLLADTEFRHPPDLR